MHQGTPVLALTAAATDEIVRDTLKGLAMKTDTHHISVSPDRPNIYLYKAKVNKDLMSTFAWLVNTIKKEANETQGQLFTANHRKTVANFSNISSLNLVHLLTIPLAQKKFQKAC